MTTEKLSKWMRRFLVFATAGLCGLFAAELGARFYSRHYHQRVMTYDSVIGWRPIPNSRSVRNDGFGAYHIAINSKGFRGSEHSFEKNEGTYRVVVLGDSIPYGYGGVEQDEMFTELVQDGLPSVEVINLGIPAFSTDQEYLYLKEHGLKYQPDLVLLSMYQDDFAPTFERFVSVIGRPKGSVRQQHNRLAFSAPDFRWYYLLAENSILAGFADSKFNFVRRMEQGVRIEPQLTIDEKSTIYKTLLAEIRNLCHSRGSSFAIMIEPGYRLAAEDDYTRRIAVEFAQANNVPILDLNEVQAFRGADAPEKYSVGDDIHPNAEGHRLIADHLQTFLAGLMIQKNPGSPVHEHTAGSVSTISR